MRSAARFVSHASVALATLALSACPRVNAVAVERVPCSAEGCAGHASKASKNPSDAGAADASVALASGGAGSTPGSGGSSSGSGGRTASGRASAGMGGNGSGGEQSDAGGSATLDAGAIAPGYTLVVDSPRDGDVLANTVTVSGHVSGFLNVEVWDAMHHMPPLAQATPDADGNFSVTIDVTQLAQGKTTWNVYAWDSPPNQPFMHTSGVALDLTIAAAAGGPSDGVADPGNAYVPSDYSLKFDDEFKGGTLDTTSKWNTLAPFGVAFYSDTHQQQAFIPEAVAVGNGIVTLTAQPSTGNADGQPYSSGSITSNGTFTYGYFEARVRVPQGKGFWPTFWLASASRTPPEWGIAEIVDGVIYGNPHPVAGGKCAFVEGPAGSDSSYTISNVYEGFHIYGFQWTATDLYWYVDGTMTQHYAVDAAAGVNDACWLNLSLQVGGDWPGNPDSTTPFPAYMDVDYVRVYQR